MKAVLPLFALAALAPAQEIVITRQTDNARQSDLAYSKRSEVTFSGRVVGKLKSDGTSRAVPVRILVKSGGGTSTVDLGPTWFLRDQAASINVGDRVTVTGSKLKTGNQVFVNARQITKGRTRIVLRDTGGYPYWVARRTQAPVEPASGGVSGRISRMQNVTINGQNFNGAYVNTATGEQLVVFAPDWYYNEQQIALAPGNFIRTYGGNYGGAFTVGGGLQQPAPGLFVAGGLYTPAGFFNFTNPTGYVYGSFPGFPTFPGFGN